MNSGFTLNGECFHFFEAKEIGLVCKYCGHSLLLVNNWPTGTDDSAPQPNDLPDTN